MSSPAAARAAHPRVPAAVGPAPAGTVATGSTGAGPLGVLVGFTAVLRRAGLRVTTERVAAFLQAVEHGGVTDRTETYWAGRLTLCADPEDLPRYDLAFITWFDPALTAGPAPAAPHPAPPPRVAALDPAKEGAAPTGTEPAPEVAVAASGEEVLRHLDLGELTPAERAHLHRLLARLRPVPPTRPSRRRRTARRGAPDPGRTLRAAQRTHGEVRALHRRDVSRRPRRVVLLIDVSGSMQPYADALLRFAHLTTRAAPTSTEVFTLGTRLTRITRELTLRDPEEALRAAARAIPDWSGGTRLGDVMRAFLHFWGQRGTARRAVVVVFSDGWERGDATLLGAQVARLSRLTHRLVWVSPHAGKDGYAPIQGGIAAALPHLDDLLAGHSLATLETLLEVVGDA
ncbi:MAG TPA: VWA domain-containing protein [Blastococcus sp.]